jgi:hypothetical protein
MLNSFLAVPIALNLIAASGVGVPSFDVRPSCDAAAAAEMIVSNTMQSCLTDEQKAHDQLLRRWADFNSTDRIACIRATVSFEPTYTELLTCLEMASEAKKLPENLY